MDFFIFVQPKHITMQTITLSENDYQGVATGVASAIIINEDEQLILNQPVLIKSEMESASGGVLPTLECSVNVIRTDTTSKGLKKGYSLLFVSVIRHHIEHLDDMS